jgi:hypothetical protein
MATKSYPNFTYNDIENLTIEVKKKTLNLSSENITPSLLLRETLDFNLQLPLDTESAKSHLIVSPILNELRRINNSYFTYFTGYNFNIDTKLGLKGFCDFLLTKELHTPTIQAPVIGIVEAKKDNVDEAVPQCIAMLYAAQLFNQKKKIPTEMLYGICTTGFEWLVVELNEKKASIDTQRYYLVQLPELLGVLQNIINYYKVKY